MTRLLLVVSVTTASRLNQIEFHRQAHSHLPDSETLLTPHLKQNMIPQVHLWTL